MTSSLRIGAVGVAAVLAATLAASGLAGSSRASAIPSAKFFVSGASQVPNGPGGVKFKFVAAQAESDIAKATFYVPQGYRLTSGQAAATKLGTTAATVFARDLNAVVPVTGTVEVAAASEFAAESTTCTGTTTHTDFWALRLQAAGTPLTVPVFVDAITSGPLATIASAQLVLCLPPSDVPAGTPGRATLGAKVLTAEFTSSAFANPASAGDYTWRTIITPYGTANGRPDAASTVELQSIVSIPGKATLTAKGKKPARGVETISFSGAVTANLKGVADVTVDVYKGSTAKGMKKFKSLSTDTNGAFSGSFTQKQGKRASFVYLLAKATLPDRDLGAAACKATFVPPLSPLPIPCQDATAGGYSVSSALVKVTVPAAPKKK